VLGRFIQPDTIVPDPTDSQQLNRYTYVNNNPLKYTDPSGHDFGISAIIIGVIIGAAIGGAVAAATGGNIGMGILTGAIGGAFGGLGAWAGGVIGGTGGAFAGAVAGGAAGGAVSAAVSGGNVGMGALTGAVSGAIAFGVSQIGFSDPSNFSQELVNAGLTTAGGAAGGAAGAALQGGDPALGAKYGAMGASIGFGVHYFLKNNNGQANANDNNPGHHLMRLVGQIWNLPNTVIGFAWGLIGTTSKSEWRWNQDHNAFEITNHRFMKSYTDPRTGITYGSGLTLGNVITYSGSDTDYTVAGKTHLVAMWQHEMQHTYQGQQLGPLYLPLHIFGMGLGTVTFTGHHGPLSIGERGPESYPPRPWR
jgi:hypothetical protein